MNRIVKRVTIGVVVLLALAALAWPKLDLKGDDRIAPAQQTQGPMTVSGFVVEPAQLVDRVVTTGTLRANEEVELASEVSGKIIDILFEEGSYVEQGQLLVKINDADLVAQRERTVYRIKLAEQQVERQKVLLARGGISQEEFDLTQNELRVLEAELQLHDALIAKTEVRAPFSGRLGLRLLSEGSYITPQSRIASLQDVTPIKIDFSLPEKYAGTVREGSTIRFRVTGQDEVFTGTVYAVEPSINEDTRTVQARATSPNADRRLLPGAFAEIELILNEYDEALTVPTIAVIPELGGRKIFVVENGRVAERPIETGIRTEASVQVLSGVTPGDTVLTSGLQLVRAGMPIEVEVGS